MSLSVAFALAASLTPMYTPADLSLATGRVVTSTVSTKIRPRPGDRGVDIGGKKKKRGTKKPGTPGNPGGPGKPVNPGGPGNPDDPTGHYETTWTYGCAGNEAGVRNVPCASAYWACGVAEGMPGGPLIYYWRRWVPDAGSPEPWQHVGQECYPRPEDPDPAAPTPDGPPVLTPGRIIEEWRHTPFAEAFLTVQPPNGKTLVQLPVFAEAGFPSAGFEPGEVNNVTILGIPIRIRPTLSTYRYRFGDGTVVTTKSPGGPYPDGDVRHTYTTAGKRTLSVDTVYGGEFSIDGGEWVTIDATITIPGTAHELDVRTTHNRLTVAPTP